MGHSLYHIAYSYYKDRFLRGNGGKPTILGELFKKLLEQSGQPPEPAGLGKRLRGMATGIVLAAAPCRRLSDLERTLVNDFSALFSTAAAAGLGRAADGRAPHVPHRLPDQPRARLQLPAAVRGTRAARAAAWRACKPWRRWDRWP